MNKLSRKHFWEWFSKNNHEYVKFKTKSKKEINYWKNELSVHLSAQFKFLGGCIAISEQGKMTFTITAYGRAQYFKRAEALVNKAPALPGWEIEALENERPIDFACDDLIQKTGIDPRELFFSVYNEPNFSTLKIYHPLVTKENEFLIYDLANQAVYNLLGERSFGEDIDTIVVANLSTVGKKYLKPLEEIVYYVGVRLSGMVVDEKGRLG